jgi:hypothetical protein
LRIEIDVEPGRSVHIARGEPRPQHRDAPDLRMPAQGGGQIGNMLGALHVAGFGERQGGRTGGFSELRRTGRRDADYVAANRNGRRIQGEEEQRCANGLQEKQRDQAGPMRLRRRAMPQDQADGRKQNGQA